MWVGQSDNVKHKLDSEELIRRRREDGLEVQHSRTLKMHLLEQFMADDNITSCTTYKDDDWGTTSDRGLPPIWVFSPSQSLHREHYTLVTSGLAGTPMKAPISNASAELLSEHKKYERVELMCYMPATWDPVTQTWPFDMLRSIMAFVIDTGYWIHPGVERPHQVKKDGKYMTPTINNMRVPFAKGSKLTHTVFVNPIQEERDFASVELEDLTKLRFLQVLPTTEREAQWKQESADFGLFMLGMLGETAQLGYQIFGPIDESRPCCVDYLQVDNRVKLLTASEGDSFLSIIEESFLMGQKVEVQRDGEASCITGRITRVAGDQTYDIEYEDGSKELGVPADMIQRAADSIRTNTLVDITSPLKVGQKIEAQWRGRARFYPGRITADRADGTFDVAYNDGMKEAAVPRRKINPLNNSSYRNVSTAFFNIKSFANLNITSSSVETVDITITIFQGRDLVAKDRDMLYRKTTSDPYVMVYYGGTNHGKTVTIQKSLNPDWGGHEFEWTVGMMTYGSTKKVIELRIFDEDKFTSDDVMGTALIPLPEKINSTSKNWYPVGKGEGKYYCSKATGEVLVEVQVWES